MSRRKQREWNEAEWVRYSGHSSLCNCIRRWRGRLIVTRRHCDCGSTVMTHEKAVAQAESEIGALAAETQGRIVQRVKELMKQFGPSKCR